jgi:hypothetical protein
VDELDAIIESLPFFRDDSASPVAARVATGTRRKPVSGDDFRLLSLAIGVDTTALLLARWIFRWRFRRHQRDLQPYTRRRLLEELVWTLFCGHVLDSAERELTAEHTRLVEAVASYKAGTWKGPAPTPLPVPWLPLESLVTVKAHIVDAVILRVIEIRDGDRDDPVKDGAWLGEFHKACLEAEPRLITPAVTVETLGRRLQRLRVRAELPTVKEFGLRRSHRSLGRARLRAWGFGKMEE